MSHSHKGVLAKKFLEEHKPAHPDAYKSFNAPKNFTLDDISDEQLIAALKKRSDAAREAV